MCFQSKRAVEAAHAKALAARSDPSPCKTCHEHSPAQLVTLVQGMSRSDWRALKHEVKAEKRAVKAEMKAYKHELRADSRMDRREQKAMKHAVMAQLWGDVIARQVERLGQRQRMGAGQMGQGPEYQTLRDDGIERGVVGLPEYDEVVEKKDMRV
jgi:hypothetical protein